MQQESSGQSDIFYSNYFDEVNQSIEDNYEYCYPPEDPDDYRSDMDNDHDLVADIDSDTLIIRIVKFLERGKAPDPDNIHIEVLRQGFEKILGRCNTRYHRIRLLVNKKIGIQPVHHVINIRTMCSANFRIWKITTPEQICPACPAFPKIN